MKLYIGLGWADLNLQWHYESRMTALLEELFRVGWRGILALGAT